MYAGNAVSQEQRAQSRSERKRSREKQRRSDVNKQFNDLTNVLSKIESEDVTALGIGRLPLPAGGNTNRVELIARTITVLERIHDTNKKRKQEMQELVKQLEETKKIAEDTATRLKEATLYQQGPQKPVCSHYGLSAFVACCYGLFLLHDPASSFLVVLTLS